MLRKVDSLYEFQIEQRDRDENEVYDEGRYYVRVIDQNERNLNIFVSQHGGSFEDYFSLGMYAGICWITDYVNEVSIFIDDIDNVEENTKEFLSPFNLEPLEAAALAEIFKYLVRREYNEMLQPSAGRRSHYQKRTKDPFEYKESNYGIDSDDLPFSY